MTIFQKTLMGLAVGSLLSVGAQAAVNLNFAGQPYIGVKAGQVDVDIDNASTDKATTFGVYGGYNFDPYFGVELEYLTSNDEDATLGGVKGEYDMSTFGAYGTYRYPLPVNGLYAKGKLGIAKTDIDASAGRNGKSISSSSDETSLAGGLGLGFDVSPNLSVEGEYSMLGSDADLMSIGAHVKF